MKHLKSQIAILATMALTISCADHTARGTRSAVNNVPRPPAFDTVSTTYPDELIPLSISVKPDPTRDKSLEPFDSGKDSFHIQIDELVEQEKNITEKVENLPSCSSLNSYISANGCSIHVNHEGKDKHAADVKIYLADRDQVELKEIVYVFAPHRYTIPLTINQEAQFITNRYNARYFFNAINRKNVSVVFVSFSASDIYTKGVVLKSLAGAKVIKQVNQLKSNDSESMLIGFSLGGVIARMSLLEIESNNSQHLINNYVSFDAPHRGVHVPVGLQNLMPFLSDSAKGAKKSFKKIKKRLKYMRIIVIIVNALTDFLNDGESDVNVSVMDREFSVDVDIDLDYSEYEDLADTYVDKTSHISHSIDAYNSILLESQVSQELIIQQNLNAESDFANENYLQLQNNLNSIGMPRNTISNIGVANGSVQGVSLPISAESYATVESDFVDHFELDFKIGVAKRSGEYIFEGFFVYPHWKALANLPWDKYKGGYDHHKKVRPKIEDTDAILDLDVSPCAYINIENGLRSRMSETIQEVLNTDLTVHNPYACFIPTTSSLASTLPIDSKATVSAHDSLFDVIIGSQQNSSHLEFTNTITNKLIDLVLSSY